MVAGRSNRGAGFGLLGGLAFCLAPIAVLQNDGLPRASSTTGLTANTWPAPLAVPSDSPPVAPPVSTRVAGFGLTEFDTTPENPFIALETTLTVPPAPPAEGTLFLWPGLEPPGEDRLSAPVGHGVLQSVLTWGPACTPGVKPDEYSTWWISGQYVNPMGHLPGLDGCQGGAILPVSVGDRLHIRMTLAGNEWTQTVTNASHAKGNAVDFTVDLGGQPQVHAYFDIEQLGARPASDVVFTGTTLTFASPSPSACAVVRRGENDVVATPRISADGRTCLIESMTLRARPLGG